MSFSKKSKKSNHPTITYSVTFSDGTSQTTAASAGPQVGGWRQSNNDAATETTNSVRTVGNLKFRWNSNDYLEVMEVVSNSHNVTEKRYSESGGLVVFDKHTASGGAQYSTSSWEPIYETGGGPWNVVPTSLPVYQERLYEILEFNSPSGASSVFNKYSIVTWHDGWSRFQYHVTFANLGPTQ